MIFRQWLIRVIWFAMLPISILSIQVVGQSAELSFNLAPRFEIGYNTMRSTVADFDGDGIKDTLSNNEGDFDAGIPAEIRILFGNGSGGFDEELSLFSYHRTFPVAAGDLNNDGKTDFVTAGWGYNAIGVHLNLGNRQFAAAVYTFPQTLPAPNAVNSMFWGLEIGDFDGDGTNDVVALQGQTNQFLRFFRCSQAGALSEFSWTRQFQNGVSYRARMSVGDINDDTRADVVFFSGNVGSQRIDFVFGQPSGTPLTLSYGMDVFDEAVGINIKDLDNDGDKDMSIAFLDTTTPTRHFLQIFRNNGSGGFAPLSKMWLEYAFPPDDITTADFTGDGKPDIAALIGSNYTNGLMVLVLNGVGDCTFIGEEYYAVSQATAIFSTDLNQDNKADILTTASFGLIYNHSSVLINHNNQEFKAPKVTLWGPSFIDAGDFNNDGYNDLASSWASDFTTTSGVDILINDTSGSFFPEVHHPSPRALNGMQTGDFTGDGKWDALSIHEDNARVLAAYIGNGSGTLESPVITQFTRGLLKFVVGKFNSDIKDDVFIIDDSAQGHVMLSNGNGTFSLAPGSPMSLPGTGQLVPQSGDFNGDGKLDLILSRDSQLSLWVGDGAGRFTETSATIPAMSLATPGDFNGDGKLDLAGMADEGITGTLGNGTGEFGPGFYRPIEGTYSIILTSSLVSEDFDLDGADEVAILMSDNYNGNLIIMQYEDGGGTHSWKTPIFFGVGPASRTWGGMLVSADFDTDGKPDLGYLGDNARGIIYNTTPRNKSIFDFDGDSKTDIGIFRPGPGEWWYQRSSDLVVPAVQFGTATDRITPGDFTGDGKTDIAFWRPSSGEWFILRSEDSTFFAFPFGAAGDIPAPADYDADGRADAAVFRPSTTTWFISNSGG
ncbi:MAG: VCBS repeat-containing protein, partial [Pyrinomonadaceae bacterium]